MFRDQTAGRRPREKKQKDKGAGQRKNGSGSIVVVLVVVVLERTKWGRTRGSVRSAGLLPCIPGVVLVRARTGVAPWFHLSFAASLPRSASTLSSLAQRCVVFIRVYLVVSRLGYTRLFDIRSRIRCRTFHREFRISGEWMQSN